MGAYGSIFDTFLVEYLRNSYIETRYISEGKEWPQNQPKYYVNLAVIHGSRTQEEMIFGTQHNNPKKLQMVLNFYFQTPIINNQGIQIHVKSLERLSIYLWQTHI